MEKHQPLGKGGSRDILAALFPCLFRLEERLIGARDELARIIGGKEGAYRYLPASVGSFPPPEEMLALMRAVGYVNCHWQPYTFGIAGLYTGERAGAPISDTGAQ